MILSDRYRFIFIHIPKCAGTSVRNAVLPFHDADSRFLKTVEHHPELGEIDFRHLPLSLLRELDHEAFDKLESYESYALLRDPFQRFRSAMAQRAKMYLGKEFAQLDDKDIRDEIGKVITYLQSEPAVIAPDYVHFARQSIFVETDGRRMVRNLYPVERMDCFVSDLARHIGTDTLEIGHANRTTVFRYQGLSRVMYAGSAVARRVLPGPIYEKMRVSARKILMKPNTSSVPSVFDEPDVRGFVQDYYAADIALHRKALEGVVA
ncbi:sulfotransferase family 2 domain-containing protein [Ruegeria arenilitoris]|uniref:sulfotransferase family 2 domain-containing protein n=1 Tax=Ruegeria arenilitoris TaxID=1173585 RepID=UPI00147F5E35|nr:sulfotransferase family 2 domain-containing protein [Ruegeria arenilitoris]